MLSVNVLKAGQEKRCGSQEAKELPRLKHLLSLAKLQRNANKEFVMPKVGGKKFSYGKAGQKAAKTYAKKTGQKMTKVKPKSRSGKK